MAYGKYPINRQCTHEFVFEIDSGAVHGKLLAHSQGGVCSDGNVRAKGADSAGRGSGAGYGGAVEKDEEQKRYGDESTH
jgi:hypothetical protein